MVVPHNRLLFWVAVVVLPFSVIGGAVSWLAVSALAALALVDAVGARRGLAGIALELPAVIRMSRDREGRIELRVRNPGQKPKTIRLGLALPDEIESAQEDVSIALPGEAEWSRFEWSCVPRKRGSYRLDAAYVETGSPLGFWAARKRVAANSELRVYPNLFNERRNLAALFLHRGAFGLHTQRQLGKGREFEKLREYLPGDSFDDVHWKATARRGRPVTKVFQIERTQEVYVIIDASRLSARPSEGRGSRVGGRGSRVEGLESAAGFFPTTHDPRPSATTLERFITAALVLGLAAEQQGDLFGLLSFTNKVERFVRAKNGKAHFSACRDALYTLEPQIVAPDYDELCTFIRLRLRRRALLVFLTSLDDPVLAESFVRNIEMVRRQHLVMVNMLQLPGVAPVFTNPNVASVDDLYQELGGHMLWQNLRELDRTLQRRGVRFSLLKNERLSAELVSQYLSVKQRQLL